MTAAFVILLAICTSCVLASSCKIKNVRKVYDLKDKEHVVLYGVRDDGAVMVQLAKDFEEYKWTDFEVTSKAAGKNEKKKFSYYKAFMMIIDDTVQLLVALREKENSMAATTHLYYLSDLAWQFTEEKQFVVGFERLKSLFKVEATKSHPFGFHDVNEKFYGYSSGLQHKIQLFFKVSNNGRVVKVSNTRRIQEGHRSLENPYEGNIKCVKRKRYEWEAKSQIKGEKGEKMCIAATKDDFFVTAIYQREAIAKAYRFMADGRRHSAGAIPSWSSDVNVHYVEGDIFIGVWKSALFAVRAGNPVLHFRDILNLVDLNAGGITADSFKNNEDFYLLSATGQETIVVVAEKDKFYCRVYYTNVARKRWRFIPLRRSEMKVQKLRSGETVDGADYDPSIGELRVQVTLNTRNFLYTTKMDEQQLFNFKRTPVHVEPKLTDSTTGKTIGNAESSRKLQYKSGRVLRRIGQTIFLKQMQDSGNETILSENGRSELKYLLYFPINDVDKSMLEQKRKEEYFFRAVFGVSGCELFVVNDPSVDIEADNTGCNSNAKIRVFSSGPMLVVVWEEKNGLAKYFTTTVEVPVDSKDFNFRMKLQNAQNVYSFSFKEGTFDQIYADRHFIYYRLHSSNPCPLKFGVSLLSSEHALPTTEIPCPAIYDSKKNPSTEVKRLLYDPVGRNLFYELKMGKGSTEATHLGSQNIRMSRLVQGKWKSTGGSPGAVAFSLTNSFLAFKNERGAAEVVDLTADNPAKTLGIRNIRFAGVFDGSFVYKPNRVLGTILRTDAMKDAADVSSFIPLSERNDTVEGTTQTPKPIAFDFGGLSVAEQQVVIEEPCPPVLQRNFALPLLLKVCLVDLLLFILLVITVLYHRIRIVPARRRYKIKRGIVLLRKKRDRRARAKRRLAKLNIVRRRHEKKVKAGEEDASQEKKKSSSSSSSDRDLVTGAATGAESGPAASPATPVSSAPAASNPPAGATPTAPDNRSTHLAANAGGGQRSTYM